MAEDLSAESKDVKIGELLVAVGVVSSGDLQEAIQIARRMNLPIGRVIVMSGVINEGNLQYALEAQSLVKDGLLEIETAITALKNCYAKETSLQDALADLRWAPKKDVSSNKLGELLVDSNMVSQAQLDQALQASFDTGMPLGGTLVIQGVLSAQLLPMVLNAQEQIRDGKITRTQAVDNLKAALMFWAKADDSKTSKKDELATSYSESGGLSGSSYQLPEQKEKRSYAGVMSSIQAETPPVVPSNNMGLVDMMKMAGYCSEQEIQAAIERALANADIASKLFMATGLLSKASFDNFLRCRALMLKGALRPEQAIYALSACRIRGASLEDVFHEMGIKLTGN
ncbi:MAG: hypothetical protein K2X27_05940 [Candidatus Obscuribacterales bacterium]|nr:hypothetical protein [Candidatus Obscuribacterales bacterium]